MSFNVVRDLLTEVVSVSKNGLFICSGATHYCGFFFREELLAYRDAIDKTLKYYDDNNIEDRDIEEFDEIHKPKILEPQSGHIKNNVVENDLYLIKNKNNNTLKIGQSKNVKKRLRQLQSNTSDELEILFSLPHMGYCEESLLNKFKFLNIRGEWFKNDGSIIKYFEQNLL